MKIYFKMKTFIVVQMIVAEITKEKTSMDSIVRKVTAESKESAIGKFVISTSSIMAVKKLEIECYELSNLKSIN